MDEARNQSYNEWLVINSQLGDSKALNELLENWYQRLLVYAVRRLEDPAAAEEVVQETLLSITRGLGKLRDPAAFPKWCFQVLDRRCSDYFRKLTKRRQHQIDTPIEALEQSHQTLELQNQLEPTLTVDKLLNHLEPEVKSLLKLYYQESFTVKEIAQITGIPQGTVKSRLYYGRKLLASILEN